MFIVKSSLNSSLFGSYKYSFGSQEETHFIIFARLNTFTRRVIKRNLVANHIFCFARCTVPLASLRLFLSENGYPVELVVMALFLSGQSRPGGG